MARNQFQITACYYFILLFFVVSSHALEQQNRSKVHFLFQSTIDKNQIVLVESKEINILFIQSSCESCFQKIKDVEKLNNSGKYVVVTSTKNLNLAQRIASKVESSSKLYYDPGGRFMRTFNLQNIEASYLRLINGKAVARRDFLISRTVDDPYKLQIWK